MSYRSLTSFQPPFAPQTAAKREPTRPTSSNLNPIRDPASAPSRKGKERATEQDELAWERDRPHLKSLSSFLPPLPPVTAAAADRPRSLKRTSRPTSEPRPKRIPETDDDEQGEEVDDGRNRTDGTSERGEKRTRIDPTRPAAAAVRREKPMTSILRRHHLGPTLPNSDPSSTSAVLGPVRRLDPIATSSTSDSECLARASASAATTLTKTTRSTATRPLTSRSFKLVRERHGTSGDGAVAASPPKKLLTTLKPPSRIKLEGIASAGQGDGARVLEDDEFSFSSPEKKGAKKPYLPAGIAARANSILTAAKTDHTLWLHGISRKLYGPLVSATRRADRSTDAVDRPRDSALTRGREGGRSKAELEELIEPDLKLIIVEVLDLETTTTLSERDYPAIRPGGGGGWASRHILSTRCRLDLSGPTTRADASEDANDLDLTGPVLFSLHNHRHSSSSSSSTLLHPQVRPKPDDDDDDRYDADPVGSDGASTTRKMRSLFIPQGPHDLSVFRPGQEVWAFASSDGAIGGGGICEIELNEDRSTWKVSSRSTPRDDARDDDDDGRLGSDNDKEKANVVVDRGRVDNVRRDERAGRAWAGTENDKVPIRDRVRKGLVVTKFGIVV